jgi:hypothetical protein
VLATAFTHKAEVHLYDTTLELTCFASDLRANSLRSAGICALIELQILTLQSWADVSAIRTSPTAYMPDKGASDALRTEHGSEAWTKRNRCTAEIVSYISQESKFKADIDFSYSTHSKDT